MKNIDYTGFKEEVRSALEYLRIRCEAFDDSSELVEMLGENKPSNGMGAYAISEAQVHILGQQGAMLDMVLRLDHALELLECPPGKDDR